MGRVKESGEALFEKPFKNRQRKKNEYHVIGENSFYEIENVDIFSILDAKFLNGPEKLQAPV